MATTTYPRTYRDCLFLAQKMPALKKVTRSIDCLPEELIHDILLRVPVEDLARSRRVSKFWGSLISSPSFGDAALARSRQHPQDKEDIILTATVSNKSNDELLNHYILNPKGHIEELHVPKGLCVHYSCNGLLLLQNRHAPVQLYIFNPITAQFVALPPAKYSDAHWALVHDTCLHKYKVYGICTNRKLIVLTQGETNWTEVDIPVTLDNATHVVLTPPLLFRNTELSWLTRDADHKDDHLHSYYLFSVNIKSRDFLRTKLPSSLLPAYVAYHKSHRHLLSHWEGSMCVTIVYDEVLIMFLLEDRDNCLWSKSHGMLVQPYVWDDSSTGITSFLSQDTCVVLETVVVEKYWLRSVKVLVHFEDELFFCMVEGIIRRHIGFLSKEHVLSTNHVFHSNSLVRWV